MATRNKTLLYIQLRNSYTKFKQTGSDESQNLLVKINVVALPPKWYCDLSLIHARVDTSAEIDELIQNITLNITKLSTLHKKHFLPGFNDKNVEESQIQALTTKITADFAVAGAKTKLIRAENATLNKNIQTAYATRIQDLSAAFRKSQSTYLDKIRGLESKHQNTFIKEESSDPNDDMAVVESNNAVLNKRDKEIADIAKSINGLASIFKDMQAMVIDQGTVLDRIDYNVEQTGIYIEEAHGELVKAHKYQDNKWTKYCIYVLAAVISILVLVVVFKPRKSYASPPSVSPDD